MSKTFLRFKTFVFSATCMISLFGGLRIYSAVRSEDSQSAYENLELYATILEQLRVAYVDDEKTEYRDLVYGSLKGMLERLDPYCQFMDPDEYKIMEEDTAGEFGGIGAVIGVRDGILTIIAPMEDTPGFKAGLLSGDRIIEVNGESTEGMNAADAVKELRGQPGSEVKLKILRPRTDEIREVTIVRAVIEVPSVKDAQLYDGNIGYVRVAQFDEHTADDLKKAIIDLQQQNMDSFILDLRNNPGGLLSAAVEVSEFFLPRGKDIVSTKGRNGSPSQIYRARGRTHYTNFPMVILVNSGSASASEIVSGALQDNRRAILLGEKTYGKGSVQSIQKMGDGSALRYTTALYFTPSGRLIHEKGIEPDIMVPLSADTLGKLLLRQAQPKLLETSEWSDLDLDNIEDMQLERGMDVLKGLQTYQAKRNYNPPTMLKAEK